MSHYKLSTKELEKHLAEQLGLLQRSAHAFDEGYEDEAKRMAVILRVLLHTGGSPSLLKQLGRQQISFLDTASPFNPANLLTTHGLITLRIQDGKMHYAAKLDSGSNPQSSAFAQWWVATVFVDNAQRRMSRADVVLAVANKDGGAHVDASLPGDYASLSRGNSLGWTADGKPLPGRPELIAIRQIAHEVLKTLVPGYARTGQDVRAVRRGPRSRMASCASFPVGNTL